MQKNWNRRHELVMLAEATLTDLLQPVFPGRRIVEAEILTAGLCNTNYKIRIAGYDDPFVLRLYIRSRAACQKDYDLFNLIQTRVPVPELLYVNYESLHHENAYAVMKYVDGILLSDVIAAGNTRDIVDCARAVGETLAHIGAYTFPQPGFFGPGLSIAQPFEDTKKTFIDTFRYFLFDGQTGVRLGERQRDQLWNFILAHAYCLDSVQDCSSLVHSDFKGVNILVRQERERWKVAAVLDWEFAFAGSSLIDIANMLRYERLLPAGFEATFIGGYQEEGGLLPGGWKRTSKLLDLLSLCEFLNAPHPNSALIEEVKSLIVGTIEYDHT